MHIIAKPDLLQHVTPERHITFELQVTIERQIIRYLIRIKATGVKYLIFILYYCLRK